MKKPFVPYASQAANLNTPVAVRGRILATAVALAIACRIPVPSEELDSPSDHYSNHIEATALRIISQFNEATILDLAYAKQLGKVFWEQRYSVIHNCPRLIGVASFFDELYGVASFFSDAEQSFFNDYRVQIANLYTTVCPVVEDLLNDKDD